ncbi:two-component system, NarL family, nitrate/nitrite sensor histidine kinase NarQ [Paenibacillus polysaccharolyticus]|uniref:histidine kinase n=1 Tax=Paenibacillus polysaccharolyticus TaxID=582692 RepID=A0A1G5H360_9BACL|nr:histidine kinase [Paenibacillus polysaccharolyticus]SCY58206.1 two-component system, NarL family, nitrate/nitrite sensor histidine kinase NarQ [Paenibacillus polysaccharolyticus]
MSYKQIKWMILLIPTITVGLWEYIRHQFLMPYLSMDAGNWLTPVIVYLVSVTLLSRLFLMLEGARAALEQERASKTALEARDQLARELHDGISQSLFLLSVKTDKAGRSLAGTSHEQDLREIQKTVHEVNTYVRQAIAQLRYVPSPVADPEAVALQAQVESIVSDTVPEADIEWNLTEVSFSAKEQVELLACIREALLNVRKHAHATKVEVYTKGNASNWSVHIRDNGIGIQGDPMLFKDRYGLRITKERAEQMGWTFQLDSASGNTQMIIGKGQT